MKLSTFIINNETNIGIVKDNSLFDLSLLDPKFNTDMKTSDKFIAQGH